MSKYLSADQNWTDGNTVYWFEFDGAEYGIVESGPETYPVDHNSRPLRNDALATRVCAECIVTDAMRAQASGL